MQLTLYPCDPFYRNNCNLTNDIVKKDSLIVLNVKLQVKLKFKTYN